MDAPQKTRHLSTMVTIALLAAAALLTTRACVAQEHASVSVITVDRHSMIEVSNGHQLPIEAFLVTLDFKNSNSPLQRIHYDVHANYRNDIPILPGTSRRVPLPRIVGQDPPVAALGAVVFTDGTSEGDALWVQELLQRRKILIERIEEVKSLLKKMSDQGLTREQGLLILQQAWATRRQANENIPAEQRVWHDQVFYMASSNLKGRPRSDGSIPEFTSSIRHLNRALDLWYADLQSAKPSAPKPGS